MPRTQFPLTLLLVIAEVGLQTFSQWSPYNPYYGNGPPPMPNNNIAIGYPTAYGLWTGRGQNGWNNWNGGGGPSPPGMGTGFGSPIRCLNGGAHIGQCRLDEDSICLALGGVCSHGACCTTPFSGALVSSTTTTTTFPPFIIDGEATETPPKLPTTTSEEPFVEPEGRESEYDKEYEEWHRLIERARTTTDAPETTYLTVTPIAEINENKRCASGLRPVGPCTEDADCPTLHLCELEMCCYSV